MSWAGFQKKMSRATTTVMMKTGMSNMNRMGERLELNKSTGHVERTNDRDYEVEERYTFQTLRGRIRY